MRSNLLVALAFVMVALVVVFDGWLVNVIEWVYITVFFVLGLLRANEWAKNRDRRDQWR